MRVDAVLVSTLRQAFAALQAGRIDDALHLSMQATDRAPANFDAWRIRALAHAQRNEVAAQCDALQRACALRPHDPAAALDLGTLLLDTGEPAEAVPWLRIAMDAPQLDPRAAFRYGTAQARIGDGSRAIEGFEHATAREPGLG